MIERLTVKVKPHFDNKAFKRIEETGAITVLREFAARLTEMGDPATVLEHGGEGKPVIVAVHWDFQDKGSGRFLSRGVGLKAIPDERQTTVFTTGDGWGYLNLVPGYPSIFRNSLTRANILTSEQMVQLEGYAADPTSLSIRRQLMLAVRLAQPQPDDRFGEGERALRGKIDLAHTRVLF